MKMFFFGIYIDSIFEEICNQKINLFFRHGKRWTKSAALLEADTGLFNTISGRKDTVLQLEGVTLVAVLLHQIRRGFAKCCNIVATPLVYRGNHAIGRL